VSRDQRYRRRRRLLERLPHALAGDSRVGVPVVFAHQLAPVLVTEVKRDQMRRQLKHVQRVPAEVVTGGRV